MPTGEIIGFVIIGVLVTALIGVVVIVAYGSILEARAAKICLSAGYSEVSFFLQGESYCRRIENATTITVPLSEVMGE